MDDAAYKASVRWLSREYFEHNGLHVEVLDRPPSALEFLRLTHISRPVVIRGFEVPASRRWSNEYLINQIGAQKISIAVTPNGLADAVTSGPGDKLYFAEPCVEKMTVEEFLSKLKNSGSREIHYLQSQNGNLYSSNAVHNTEFCTLHNDVPRDIPWCTKAFGRSPDAVNLWIGDGRSVTSIHNDPYENIYKVVRGKKYFTLLSPSDGWCLRERRYPHARYTRGPTGLTLQPSLPPLEVCWPSLCDPCGTSGALPSDVHPLYITLEAGDTLYLPASWWHHVRQSSEDITIALNWWYDMEMRGMSWVLLNYLRGVGLVLSGNIESESEESADNEAKSKQI